MTAANSSERPRFIGVTNEHFLTWFLPESHIKRAALLYDQIAIPGLTYELKEQSACQLDLALLEWLADRGVIFDPGDVEFSLLSDEQQEEFFRLSEAKPKLAEDWGYYLFLVIDQAAASLAAAGQQPIQAAAHSEQIRRLIREELPAREAFAANYAHHARLEAFRLRAGTGLDAYAIDGVPPEGDAWDATITKRDVVSLVLDQLPMPTDTTPWEDIIEFRRDPEARQRFSELRLWMNRLGASRLPIREAEEELAYLIQRYGEHLERHRIKTLMDVLEVVLTPTAALVEDIVKFNVGNLIKRLFRLRHRSLGLTEDEARVPGFEVSYLLHAQARFGRRD